MITLKRDQQERHQTGISEIQDKKKPRKKGLKSTDYESIILY